MSSKSKNRRNAFDFSDPRWADHAAGRAAAAWTRWDAPYFGGPFDRAADLRLWLVREAGGRPILACLRPRVDPAAGVVALGADGVAGAWDLALEDGSPADLHADGSPTADLARRVADLFLRQWPSAPAAPPPVPETYLAYRGRVPVRMTAEFAERLARDCGGDPTPDRVREAWAGVPTLVRSPDRSTRWLYPARFLASDSPHGYAAHPETLEPAPAPDAEAAPGWVRTARGWAPHVPLGGAEVYAATGRLGGLEAANPALAVYRGHGLLGRRDSLDDRARVDAAAARLADDAEFAPGDRLALCEAMRARLSRRVKYTLGDLTAALLNPRRPVAASTHPRVVAFPEADLASLARRGWDLRGLAALGFDREAGVVPDREVATEVEPVRLLAAS
ncbi:hypothetical protein [Planctomyces sp. SH-PL62]|uniref:hypothetical protein n=1 Tax=Planctomyces sp. SH-PL62 TaxID=1636152 RepID=UPI00078CE407|nr:hypothetical protein [Planctomyces sp. SH-PL62]AMV40934.1 hypothetical protein VT85_26100 [Planctomyces sp. SH-PL62]